MIGLSGCSLSLSGPAPGRPRNTAPKCDTTKTLVVVDGVGAAASGITALALASDSGSAAAVAALIGAAFFASAFHGNATVDDCHRELGLYASETTAPNPDFVVAPAPVAVTSPVPLARPAPKVVDPVEQQPEPVKMIPTPPPLAIDRPWSQFWRELP